MKKTEWLILGATFLGCSFSLFKDDCIILEEACTIGNEFASAFNQKKPIPFNPETNEAEIFAESLKSEGILTDSGEIYCQPAVFHLARLISEKNTEIHFDTVVCSIEKSDGGFLVEYSNCDGLQTVFAKNILDTTSLGALYQNKRDSFLSVASTNGEITNEITNTSYFFVPFEKDFITTKKKALETAKSKNFRIILMADRLCYIDEIKPYEKDGINFAPSDGFYNPLFAFEGGVLLAEKL